MGAITIPAGSDEHRLSSATHTSLETFALSRVILVFFGLVVLAFALLELPWTAFRMRHYGATGWAFSSSSRAVKDNRKTTLSNRSLANATTASLPRRIGRLPIALPTYIVPRLNLSLAQTSLLVIAFVLVIIASFTHSNWLTDSTRTGYVAITLVPCVIALGNKVFGVGTFLSVGYASVNWAHRWLGRILFLVTTIHVIAYFTIFVQTRSLHAEMSQPSNIMATISYIGFCFIFFSSIGYVRRNWWHIFKICHHFGVFLFIIGLNYHSKILRPWVVFSVIVVGISVIFRTLTSRMHIAYLTALPNSKSTIVHLPSVRSGWLPGQHVRIRVLTGGMGLGAVWEGHPFTLATADSQGEGAKLVVKAAGDWTNKLFAVAKKGDNVQGGSGGGDAADVESVIPGARKSRGYPVAVLIEGPYGGSNMVYSAYGSVLLAAGGSGVSYILGVANGIVADCRAGKAATKNLNIVWTVRDRAAINDLLPNFEELLERARAVPQLRIVITLYFTSVSRGLIIRPFSVMPTSSLFVHQSPSAPSSGPLRSAYTPSSSTAALLAPGNTSALDVSLDPKTGLAAPPQFVVGRAEEEGNEKTSSDSETEDETDDEAYDGISLDEKTKNPFSDIHAPPPPSPTTKPRFNRARATSYSPLRHKVESSSYSSPPIELKPGRPEYNHIVQHIIEHEQARARSFVETFRVLNPELCETAKGNRMSGILNTSGSGARRIAVSACGPSGMVASLRNICYDAHGVDFHAEEFSL